MTRNHITVLTLFMVLVPGCQPRPIEHQINNNAATSNTKRLNDAELVKLVQKFSEDEGEEGQKAFARLSSVPRGELIDSLSQLRNSVSASDALEPQIAFVLCFLDQDYQKNVEIVVSALSKEPEYRNFYADSAASLIARLIKRGDKSLLKDLFSAVPWSDGALTEGLGVTFGYELRSDTQAFVERLANQPIAIRTRVYELISQTSSLSRDELDAVNIALRNIDVKSKSHLVAQEMLKSVVFK